MAAGYPVLQDLLDIGLGRLAVVLELVEDRSNLALVYHPEEGRLRSVGGEVGAVAELPEDVHQSGLPRVRHPADEKPRGVLEGGEQVRADDEGYDKLDVVLPAEHDVAAQVGPHLLRDGL